MVTAAGEEAIEVTLRLEAEPVKTPELVEEFPPDDENVFVRRAHSPDFDLAPALTLTPAERRECRCKCKIAGTERDVEGPSGDVR